MFEFWDDLFVLAFAVAWPLYEARYGYPAFLREVAAGRPDARPRAYRQAIAIQWTLAAAALALWLLSGRPLAGLGLGLGLDAKLLAGAGILVLVLLLLEGQRRSVVGHPELDDQVRRQLAYAEAILPHHLRETRLFVALSVTAGICEEILFRGYLMAYAASWLGLWGGWLVASVLFGAAHLYLGSVAAVRAGVVGLVGGGLYLFTGSLWIPMLLHAALDLNAGRIAHVVYGRVGGSSGPPVDRA